MIFLKNTKIDNFEKFVSILETTKIKSWFDMGLFLDRLKDQREPMSKFPQNFSSFLTSLKKVAFITFDYGIDGVTIEIAKYSKIFEKISAQYGNKTEIIWIGGEFKPACKPYRGEYKYYELSEIKSFDDWKGYQYFFLKKLARGSDEYNSLAQTLWEETVHFALRLASIIKEDNISLLIPVNVASNPGNVALTFALVLISELLKIPVLNSCHDFFWDCGDYNVYKKKNQPTDIRDHFFCNYHLGEVFTLLQTMFPWDSPRWHQTVINWQQADKLIDQYGFNPINISLFTTFIDLEKFRPFDKEEKLLVYQKLNHFFGSQNKIPRTHSIDDVLQSVQNNFKQLQKKPIIISDQKDQQVKFSFENIILLQPTRIIARKNIEYNFILLEHLFANQSFKNFFEQNRQFKITLIITGPIPIGNKTYFIKILNAFCTFLTNLPELFRKRIFLAFKFGQSVISQEKNLSICIYELYAVAKLVTLPSQNEGRGLPIIESCASGTPIIVNPYEPKEVYEEVIGANLDRSLRLKIFEFSISDQFVLPEGLIEVFCNPDSHKKIMEHNRRVIQQRYSDEQFMKNFHHALYLLWQKNSDQFLKPSQKLIKKAFIKFSENTQYDDLFHQIVFCNNRKYLPGLSLLEFMVTLKSLIDPSAFRMEEKELQGRIMRFSEHLLEKKISSNLDSKKQLLFYTTIEKIFEYYTKNDNLAIDHSLSYRHRNRRHYPYRKVTEQELCGIIGIIFREIFPQQQLSLDSLSCGIATDLRSALREILGHRSFIINDSNKLIRALKSSQSIAWFPGENFAAEIKLFLLLTFRTRLKISSDELITTERLAKISFRKLGKLYLFVPQESLISTVTYRNVLHWLKTTASNEIKIFYQAGIFEVVPTNVYTESVHLGQLGRLAQEKLIAIKQEEGFVVAFGDTNYLMLDMLDLPSYRIGYATHLLRSHFLGIKLGDGFIQWVPAGLRPCLAYPTPIQTPREFSSVFKSQLYRSAVKKFGEKDLLEKIRQDADFYGTPLKKFLINLMQNNTESVSSKILKAVKLNGKYQDGLSWSGAMIRVNLTSETPKFKMMFATEQSETVLSLIKRYERQNHTKVSFAWNGGYILNPELVGKLGLSEDYIGAPLGLLIKDGQILSLPLYNKPAFIVDKNGKLRIQRASIINGLEINVNNGVNIIFTTEQYNQHLDHECCYYDLMYSEKNIPAQGRIIYRLIANKIIDVIQGVDSTIPILPVGVTVSVPENSPLKGWKKGTSVQYKIPFWENVMEAIEAGPTLIQAGHININMENEGWKTDFSITTQAARTDYTDMRGPKIGAGLTKNGDLIVVAINGRIRESVGATHYDLAQILYDYGAYDAMGFDPGGSVTLIYHDEQLNISPYNKNYQKSPYSLPPEPRFVGNAILGII